MSPALLQSEKWKWQQATISPPLSLQAGDVVREIGGQIVVTRGGVVVETRSLGAMTQITSSVDVNQTVQSAIFLKVNPMPGQNVSCTSVKVGVNDSVTFGFSSGTQLELVDWAAAEQMANEIDSTTDLAEKILIGKAFRASPDGANMTTQIGAQVSVNLLADNPIVYTEPE